jgi:hypothetical protein
MIKNFSQYLVEEEREVYFTFGRMNPPTIGHGKVMDTLATKSGKADYKVYLSQVSNPKKDPLSYSDKIKHVRKMFPKHARNVMIDKNVKNVFDVASRLYEQGYKKITMVVGADRLREFDVLLNKYNGVKARHGFYNFESIKVVSAGERDPDAEGVEGMSASKQRENASKNDFVTFAQGVPKSMSNQDARKLFNDVRKGMGLSEERSFKNHIELAPVSETREQYVQGELYGIGDSVVIKETNDVAIVSLLGANYVIVEMSNGDRKRMWLDAVELVEKTTVKGKPMKDSDITKLLQKYGYTKRNLPHLADRLTKLYKVKHTVNNDKIYSEKEVDYFKKSSYDNYWKEDLEEKQDPEPSKYTKAFKDMYEEVTQKQINDLEKFGDRLLNKFDIDIEFTRHFADRMNDSRNKPAISVSEIQRLFKKIAKEKGQNIKKHKNGEAVLKDIQSDLNLPVVVNFKNDEFEVVNKTIMRKKDFKTTSPVVRYESLEESFDLTEEDLLQYIVNRIGPKTWQKKHYDAAQKLVKDIMDRKRKERGGSDRHSVEYYADAIKRSTGLHIDPRTVGRLMRAEATDPVDVAKDQISKERESDRKKFDRMLDRARSARTRRANIARSNRTSSQNRSTR